MASLEKLSKGLEALKMSISSVPPTEENAIRNKDKVRLCILVTDLICSSEMKVSSNFNNHLSGSMETLFLMCDDQDANVRMVADECLNRIIRSLMDGHIAKVNVELHAEIKKNRNARSLRAALNKFAELAQTIRPNKRKVYMQSLVEHIIAIAKRREESVLETLATSLSKFLVPLGCFLLDSETKDLLQVFMKNIGSDNAVFRRTAASSILAICLNCSKSQFFIVHTINTLLESVLPVREEQNIYTILGVLNCIRGLLSHLEDQSAETGLRGSFGVKRKQKKDHFLSVDSMIQVFELCLHWTQHQDHNIVTAALETLNELLMSPPSQLIPILLNPQGLSRSRIHSSNIGWKLSTKTLSDISVATTVPPHSEDLSFLEPEDFIHHTRTTLSGWLEDGSISGSQVNVNSAFERSAPASINQDSILDYPDSESVMSEDFGPSLGAKSATSATPENELEFSRESPSPPLDSLYPLAWEIGDLTDGNQSPLLFTGRRLVTAFLVPEYGSVRVSVRSLALTCLSQVIKLLPNIFFQQVDKNGLSTPKGFSHVSDVLRFANHPDQQLRGLIRLLIGNLIHSLFSQANYGPQFYQDDNGKNVTLEELMQILITGLHDESNVCVRQSLSGLMLCLSDIMDSKHFMLADNVLERLLSVIHNPYWLVKVKLVELLCSLPFQSVYYMKGNMNYQTKILNLIIYEFLANEDNRVRKTTCEGIVKIIKKLHFTVDYGVDDVIVSRGISLTTNIFSSTFKSLSLSSHDVIIKNSLIRVVDVIVEALMLSSSKHLSSGCIEALCTLSNVYTPSQYPLSWHCCDNQSPDQFPSGGFFSIVVKLLVKSPISLDLECHQWLLKLASQLFIGLLPSVDKNEPVDNENSKLKASIGDLLVHVMRLMYIFSRVMEDNSPSRNFLSSPLKKRNPRPTSPSKNHTPEKEVKEEIKVRLIGLIGNSPHYQKLMDSVRSGYTNYKLTLDSGASEKFLSLIRHTLGCLEVMLCPNKVIDSESIFEELLSYLRGTFLLDSEHTVKVVFQLLRSLFETNLLGTKKSSTQKDISVLEKSVIENGFYNHIFAIPLHQLASQCDWSESEEVSLRKEDIEEKDRTPLSQNDRETLASRIKLFEGIVIQSLKEYTLTCNIGLQAQVLRLLTLLVQLKVNYCLLDSDHVFIDFVLKQFEYLETGQIHDAEILIPSIFHFLVHLSNEKNHSKPVISMPKIIQLCDGLMASGQNPITHSIPALLPVVEHVFFKSSNVLDQKELETQKEYLLSMLLRLAEYPQVLETVYHLMSAGWKWKDHWSRWYKQTLDSVFPLLAEGRLVSSDISVLHSIFALSKTHFAPLNNVLSVLFSPQQEGQTLSQWLRMVTVMLLSISMYPEDQVLDQLEQMNLYVREEGDDPLKVKPISKTLPPQSLLAKQILRTLLTSSSKLKQLILSPHKDEAIFDLEKSLANFLLCCVLMLQPGRFVEVSKSLSFLVKNSSDLGSLQESFEMIAQTCQIPTIHWIQIMSLLDLSFHQATLPFMPQKLEGLSLNGQLLRRGAIMINAEHLAKRPEDINSLKWFLASFIEDVIWHCHEPPIEKLLTSIYNSVPNSKILLECSSTCIKRMETIFIHRLLHTMEYIHNDLSGPVLKLVALSLIDYTNIAIARLAAAFCCRTVEFILTSDNPVVKNQLAENDLRYIFTSLSLNQRQFKRHNNLIILLNKLGKQNYNISLCEFDDCIKPVSADLIRTIQLNKSWFFSIVNDKCSKTSDCDTRKCAYFLSKLDYTDIEKIMSSKDFNMNILEHCFVCEKASSPKELSEGSQGNEHYNSPVYICAKKIILKKIKEICHDLPQKYEIFDPHESINHDLFQILSSKNFIQTLLSLIPALKNYLYSLDLTYDRVDHFENEDCKFLSRFGVLCIEAINWIIFQMPRHELKSWPSIVQGLLECAAAVFKIGSLSSSLSFEQISSICSSLTNMFKFVAEDEMSFKEFKLTEEFITKEPSLIVKTALQMVSVISSIENNPESIPNFIFTSARSLVISLGRNQKLNWLCRIPIEAWQPPLDSPTPPSIPNHILHDTEVLNQIVMRIHLLGWRGKFQFEESWVCLLSALSPNPDIDNTEQEEISAIMQANSLAIDGITRLVISTLARNTTSSETKYIHFPRNSNEKLYTLKCWKRLAEMNDLICSKLKRISGDGGLKLTRIDQRSNLERPDAFQRYGFAQVSVSYLQSQLRQVEDAEENTENTAEEALIDNSSLPDDQNKLLDNEIDILSCVQFVLDLFSQWVLPNSGISLNLQLSMIKSILCISDLFMERTHFEWMLDVFLELSKVHPVDDEIMHQYLVIGISKSCAVLKLFEGEKGERILKVVESALRSPFLPMREAGVHSLLYLLQGIPHIEKPVEDNDADIVDWKTQKFRLIDFRQNVLQLSVECIENNLGAEKSGSNDISILIISLTFYLMEYYKSEVPNEQNLIKSLMNLVKHSGNGKVYLAVLHGFERLILSGEYDLNDQVTRLALDRFSQSDPNITIPALQLLLACIYADPKNITEEKEESEPWTIEIMEKVTALFDRIKKGYPIEVEIICDILPGILSDFFSASDILTKVIGEFLSPNQPHKRNMAAIVFQVFSQACSEQQLPLLQDWVVYSLDNLTHNLPVMMAEWSLCCFFISASINPWLKAIFPLVQSRIRQCEYEDRQILCLAAVDFYSQLTPKQKEIFLESLKGASSSQHSPFTDIIACL